MVDNTELNSGSGGDTIATDDIGGVKFQRVKIVQGADGTNDGDVASGNPLPVNGSVSITGSHSVVVSGSVTVADGPVVSLSSGLTISGTQSLSSSYTVFVGNVPTVSISGSTTVVVSGPVSLTGSIQVSGITNAITVADGPVVSLSSGLTISGTQSLSSSYTVVIGNVPTVSISGSTTVVVSGPVSLTGSVQVSGITNAVTVADGSVVSLSSGLTISGTQSLSSSYTMAVSSVIPGTGATNLGKATDSAAGATDTGIVPLAVRDDALTTLTPAEGDYVPLRVGSTGALHVEIEGGSVSASGTLSITGSMSVVVSGGDISLTGSFMDSSNNALRVNIVAGGASGGTSSTDDSAFTAGSGSGTPFMGFATSDVVDSGDVGVVAMTTGRALHVDQQGPVSLTGSIQVAGITNTVTVGGSVSITGSHSVVISNVPTVSISGSTSAVVTGAAAHDAAVSGNPVLVGLEARTSNPTAVGNGDAVRAMADDMGRQVIVPNAPRDLITNNHVSLSVSTTVTLLAAGGAGVFRDLLALTISNPASAAATVTIFDDHTTGTQAFKWELAADGGGVVLVFNTPYKAAAANTGWGITSTETGVTATAQALDTA